MQFYRIVKEGLPEVCLIRDPESGEEANWNSLVRTFQEEGGLVKAQGPSLSCMIEKQQRGIKGLDWSEKRETVLLNKGVVDFGGACRPLSAFWHLLAVVGCINSSSLLLYCAGP